jgi:signal transduction histidine kinase
MKKGAERIKSIVLSLRDFSQKDKAEINLVNIHTGIESTLLILQYELSAKPDLPEIAVIKNYGDLPRVECYVAKLNQVFINLLNNAIYAVRKRKLQEIGNENYRPTIGIATELIDSDRITIRITDNGIGIPESDLARIFDPFFTTKPVGSGTGLGLSISYQIIVETHGGELKCSSELGKGTEMAIAIPIQQSS